MTSSISIIYDLTWSSDLPGDRLQPLPGHHTLRIDQTMEVSLDRVVHQHLPHKTGFKSFAFVFPFAFRSGYIYTKHSAYTNYCKQIIGLIRTSGLQL
jgi:hypothetical protein